MISQTIILGLFLAGVQAQQAGTLDPENHPRLTWQNCASGSCTNTNAEVVIDSNWRWLHTVQGSEGCYEGNQWTGVCTTAQECAQECALEGANYQATYGASTSGDALTLKFVTQHQYGKNVGSRFYLMNGPDKYQMFNLLGNEFAFDVDLSTVACGINSALYFVAMEEDGGVSSQPDNSAGAKYGTGYCDSQCARDLKFVGGKANVEGWESSASDPNSGVGPFGACCAEIDVWESNRHSFALTPHPCENNEYHVCETTGCGGTYSEDRFAGGCDANGCDYNPYRMGNTDFYGAGKVVDTTRKFTVVTRFQENKMSQYFIQDGKTIEIPGPTDKAISDTAEITPEYCTNMHNVFNEFNRFEEVGGWPQLIQGLGLPMVLVMSIWNDHYANMLWLDSTYPPEKAGQPGSARGDCPTDSGKPAETEAQFPNAQVVWSNIRFGPIGSTYAGPPA